MIKKNYEALHYNDLIVIRSLLVGNSFDLKVCRLRAVAVVREEILFCCW